MSYPDPCLENPPSGCGWQFVEGDAIAHRFQLPDQVTLQPLGVDLVEVVAAQFLVGGMCLEHPVNGYQEAVSDGYDSPFLP